MRIIASRKRVNGVPPLYEYRLVIPLDQLPSIRVAMISTRSDFGIAGGPHARVPDVIAPLDWLRMEPGPARQDLRRDIERVAKHLEEAFLCALFSELATGPVPLLVQRDEEPDNRLIDASINEITDGYRFLRKAEPAHITAERFALTMRPGEAL